MEGGERCVFSSWKYSHYFELLAGSVGAEELEHSCQIMNRDFFSFGAKLGHKNANISYQTQCACFTCGTLLRGYSANPCRIFVSHRCETALTMTKVHSNVWYNNMIKWWHFKSKRSKVNMPVTLSWFAKILTIFLAIIQHHNSRTKVEIVNIFYIWLDAELVALILAAYLKL